MGRIQSSVGILSGIPIEDTVNKLIQVASQPKDLLTNRTKLLQSEQAAVGQLSSLLLSFQFEVKNLGNESLFQSKQVTSSDSTALTAAVPTDGNPAVGSYLFTPVQTASSQQFFSQNFGAAEAVGEGTLTFQTGGFVDQGIALDQLNSGAGVARGSIRITDRNGDNAVIDLSFARTIDDVLDAISSNTTINVTATAVGDKIKLTDNTGGSGNLSVKDVAGGTTATDLGLASINVDDDEAIGQDRFTLHTNTRLSTLNDGTGVWIIAGSNELSVSFKDGTSLGINLDDAQTLGDVVAKINASSPSKLTATIAADGNRLQLNDLTMGVGTFAVSNVGTGSAATELGLTTTASGATITGRRLASGLKDTLVSSLKGGQGLGTLGSVHIVNRNNVPSDVNLASAETLGDVVAAFNTQATGVTAAVNAAHNGIVLTDNTGAIASNLIVTDGDAQNSATALGIVVNTSATSVDGGALDRKQISKATLLSSLQHGFVVQDIKITDSDGVLVLDLNQPGNEAKTIGDIIDRINALPIGVEARINDNGDGILLTDTAGGTGKLTVVDVGSGSTAKTLRIAGTSTTVDVEGTPTQVIDGTGRTTVTIDDDDTLADVVKKINDLHAGITAGLLNDGTSKRLSLKVDKTGVANAMIVDASGSTLSLNQISTARDAVVLYGSPENAGSVLLSSATNDFKSVVDGLDLTIKDGTRSPVTIGVANSTSNVVDAVQEFVDAYNSIRDSLDQTTAFDSTALTTGILFGSSVALRVDSDLSNILTSRFFGVGDIESLASVGISLNDKGHMVFNEDKLTAAVASDPDSVKKLFTDKTLGVSAKLNTSLDRLAGAKDSVLSNRTDTLSSTIDTNTDRINDMQDALDRQRELLTAQFQQIDTLIAGYQRNLQALQSLQPVAPLTSSSNSIFGS